ncbi:MAG: hypothetical protein HKN93_01785, partial [Acidimicrobiia bacterium]|nr:hypothetical protein [Acidimicrobiia bacterium]
LVNGRVADERTSGSVPYAGTIVTNDSTLDDWQDIVDQNKGQASAKYDQQAAVDCAIESLNKAFDQINEMKPTQGYEDMSTEDLDGLDTTDDQGLTYVVNVTSDLTVKTKIDITGDKGDVFILRWDKDGDPSNGYQGKVKFQSGGAFVPHGGLTPTSFINVAGDINASGGGDNPGPPYPQGPRLDGGLGELIDGGKDFKSGGFFTGYWLTTGDPKSGKTSSLSSGIFVGGWYTLSSKISMTSNTSAVYVGPSSGGPPPTTTTSTTTTSTTTSTTTTTMLQG